MASSKAFNDFKEALSIAEELIKIERKSYRNPPRIGEQKPVQGLRGAVAVLVVASFEQFLKDVIEEHLSNLAMMSSINTAMLPDSVKVCNIYNTLDHAMKGPKFGGSSTRADRLADIIVACKMIGDDTINPIAFTITAGNPNAETVKKLMKDLDVSDVFNVIRPQFFRKWKKPESATFLQDKLNEIVSRRHVVAHTANALNISRMQLNESVKFLKILALTLDAKIKDKMRDLSRIARVP